MRKSLEHTRRVRLKLGFTVSRAHKVDGIEVDWAVEDISEEEFLAKYRTNSYTRRTDDVVWLWCAGDLNNGSWPFVDTLFLMASEKADGRDRTPLNLALLARVCRDGTFHEVPE